MSILIEEFAYEIHALKFYQNMPDKKDELRRAEARLNELEDKLPSGSGFDNGPDNASTIDREKSTHRRIVIHTQFHHMDENGFYDGWTEHTIVVKPVFIGRINLRISGPNRKNIKEHIHNVFYDCLTEQVR